jgi:ferredoxin-thioredoxin reductase catalytic subunit
MSLKIIKNPDEETFKSVIAEVRANDGYCPCRLERTPATKCPCKEFREQTTEGECCCGLYQKIEVQ